MSTTKLGVTGFWCSLSMQKRTTQILGAAVAIFLALIIAAFLASVARSSRSLGASLAESSAPVIRSGQITVVVVAQRQAMSQATISPERRVRNRRNVARALATSAIPVIPSLSEADQHLIVSDVDAADPEIAFELAQGIGGPLPANADANSGAPAPVTLVPIGVVTGSGNVTVVPTVVVAQPPAAPGAPVQPSGPTATPVRNMPTAAASVIAPKPEASKTPMPLTASPAPVATAVGPTKPPATAIPTAALPTVAVTSAPVSTPRPTAVPPLPVPPTAVPTVVEPPTAVPTLVPTVHPTAIPPTSTTPPPVATSSPEPSTTLEPITYLHARVYSSDDHAPLVGWQITVYRQGSQDMLAAAATGDNGAAHMTLAPAGTRICVSMPAGWRVVHPADGCYYQSLQPGELNLEFVVAPVR